MSRWIIECAEKAEHYATFANFWLDVRFGDQMLYGWVGDRFYQCWPGGRNIDWTDALEQEKERELQRECA